MKEIEQYLSNYFDIRTSDLSAAADLFTLQTLPKQAYWLKMGQYARSMGFVKAGFLRMYAYNTDGSKEVTQWISSAGSFVTDLASFMFQAPARWNIQALSEVQVYTISKENYDQLKDLVDNWLTLEKLFISKCFVQLENRVFQQLSMSAEEKFLELLQQNPMIFNQVPLQYLASMLGMTPETLSRLRRKLLQ